MVNIQTRTIGYPVIGENREWKKTLESYWKGDLNAAQFEEQMKEHETTMRTKQRKHGVGIETAGDFTYYDRMLDISWLFNVVPERFRELQEEEQYFSMARGGDGIPACAMRKWYDTNYHYIVPEIDEPNFRFVADRLRIQQAQSTNAAYTLISPYTYLKLARLNKAIPFQTYLLALTDAYRVWIERIVAAGYETIVVEEPHLLYDRSEEEWAQVVQMYSKLSESKGSARLLCQTYFHRKWIPNLVQLPTDGIGFDLRHLDDVNYEAAMQDLVDYRGVVALGIVNGRNVWRGDDVATTQRVRTLIRRTGVEEVWLQPTCSLLHVPITLKGEWTTNQALKERCAFADEKLEELLLHQQRIVLQQSLEQETTQQIDKEVNVWNELPTRALPFQERYTLQMQSLGLGDLPTTTIGSFPQSQQVRAWRSAWRRGELTHEAYEQCLQQETERWIRIQEQCGLDVLVHGEFERNDMVEYFGEQLEGFVFSNNGWVQSYGSRCVKPPVIASDIVWQEPMTVAWTVFAQSLTNRPVKGMLTGPITMYKWSFVREDVSLQTVLIQLADALKEEIGALERAGIAIIQVDEPALREAMPLEADAQDDYARLASYAFRRATASVQNTTQIHTHMCYSTFDDMVELIEALDADVVSIESSRAQG
ncbi:MAG: 5-methyltetrahydropteroyltriglutamate--homocysteine S-methyltransferase, partial [Bacilli bacterium]